jgi:hypothetical protein
MPKSVELIWGAIASVGMLGAVFSLWREDRRKRK